MENAIVLTKNEQLMLEAYKFTLDFICHDEQRMADYYKLFSFAQAALFAIYNWSYSKEVILLYVITVFGVLFSLYWGIFIDRLRILIHARYLYLQDLERELSPISLISNEIRLKQSGSLKIGDNFVVFSVLQKLSGSRAQSMFPFFVAFLWIVIIISIST